MKHSGIFDTARRARRATGSAVLIALSALIAGCTSDGYEKLPPQAFDSDYKVFSVVGSLDGSDLDIYLIKAYESEGNVALCGGYTRGRSIGSKMSNREWAVQSKVFIEDVKIGTAVFMDEIPVSGFRESDDPQGMINELAEKKPAMPCVRSNIPWKAGYENAKIERKGPELTIIHY